MARRKHRLTADISLHHESQLRGIATRKSPLAMWQAEQTAQHLRAMGIDTEIIGTETSGDRIQNTQLSQTQLVQSGSVPHHVTTGKGLFIKEVQDLILSGRCHMAVHSMKDLPVSQTPGLVLAGFLPAGPVRDVLVFAPGKSPTNLASGTVDSHLFDGHLFDSKWFDGKGNIGTTSMRRQALLNTIGLAGVTTAILRGNVATRLGRLAAGDFSAIVLAEAGLRRLDLFDPSCMTPLDETIFIPACAQGVVGIETRAGDSGLTAAIFKATEAHTVLRIALERLVLDLLGGDCNSIIGIHCSGLQRMGVQGGFADCCLHVFTATHDFASMHTTHLVLNDSRTSLDTDTQHVVSAIQLWSKQVHSKLDQFSSFTELFSAAQHDAPLVEALRHHLTRHGHQADVAANPPKMST
jgi:hydroxymethylbilane synthase